MAVPNVFRRGGNSELVEKVATAAMKSGQVEELTTGDLVGVWTNDTASGAVGAIDIGGEYLIPKADSTLTIAVGAPVAITVTAGEASAGGASAGHHRASKAAAAADVNVWVLLNKR